MSYSYYRCAKFEDELEEKDIPLLEQDLTQVNKIQAFEDAMVDLGTFLEPLLKTLKAKVKKASATYKAMADADFDESLLDELDLFVGTGEDIDFGELAELIKNAKKLKGVTGRWEARMRAAISLLK